MLRMGGIADGIEEVDINQAVRPRLRTGWRWRLLGKPAIASRGLAAGFSPA